MPFPPIALARAWRTSLWTRIVLVLTLGFLMLLGVFALISLRILDDSTQRILTERQVIAQTAARQYDEILTQTFYELDKAASFGDFDPSIPDRADESRLLAYTFGRGGSFSLGVFFLDARGRVILAEPDNSLVGADFSTYPFIVQALRSGQRNISDPFRDPHTQRPVVAVTIPIRGAGQQTMSLLSSWIDLTNPALSSPIAQARDLGQTGHAELVDERGTVIVSTEGDSGSLMPGDHLQFFLRMLAGNAPGVDDVPEEYGPHAGEMHVMAFAPLSVAHWGVAVGGSAVETFADVRELQTDIFLFGTLSFVVIFLVTLWGARHLIQPVNTLTGAAQRIETGDLSSPIPVSGSGEIGRLEQSFEAMRIRLQKSHDEVTAWRSELETRVRERTLELERLNAELQRLESVRGRLMERVIEAQEDERKRLARELHDDFAQSLTAVSMTLQSLAHTIPPETASMHRQLDTMQALVTGALTQTGQWIRDLRPPMLDDLGLAPAIRSYAELRLEASATLAQVEFTGTETRLPPELEVTLFRVAQEAISNIARHAHARRADIRIHLYEDGMVVMHIEDDGKGFIPAMYLHPADGLRGMGLLSMRERIALVGGTLTIDSTPRRGTRIRAEVPWQPGSR